VTKYLELFSSQIILICLPVREEHEQDAGEVAPGAASSEVAGEEVGPQPDHGGEEEDDEGREDGGERMPAPAAHAWRAMAELLTQGLDALPPNSAMAVLIAAIVGVLLPVLRKNQHIKAYVPSGMAMGIAFIVQAYYSLVMFLGLLLTFAPSEPGPWRLPQLPQTWSALGEAYYRQTDHIRARKCFRESDALAVYNNEKQPDILFFNAYYEWTMAIEEQNPTREKIAFGRLKALRSSLERRFIEVEAFDEYVERGRYNA